MSNNIYFANSVNDTISVNINNGINNYVLTPRTTTSASGVVTAINCTAKQIPTGPNKDKDVFGTGGGSQNVNLITVQFENLEADDQRYHVTTSGLAGRDLYFYVFDGDLVGQDETGLAAGITITPI